MVNEQLVDDVIHEATNYAPRALSKEARMVVNKFSHYSKRNQYLLYRQYGSSGRFVATLEKWESEFHRHLKLGATPLYVSTKGYPLFVYDYADTDGEEIPCYNELYDSLYPFKSLAGYNQEDYNDIVNKITFRGIEYMEKKMSYDKGGYYCLLKHGGQYYRYGIVVNSNYDTYSKTAILFHELAHIFIDERRRRENISTDYYINEIESEIVTYIICINIGFDTSNSIKYIARIMKEMQEDNFRINYSDIIAVSEQILNIVRTNKKS